MLADKVIRKHPHLDLLSADILPTGDALNVRLLRLRVYALSA